MNTSLEYLPAPKREQLRAIADIIIRTIRPEKIILFGIYASPAAVTELFTGGEPACCLDCFDILVVTRPGDRRFDYEIQDIVENRCRVQTPVTVIVHDIGYVNGQLAGAGYFFSMIRKESILLFDAGTVALADGPPPDLTRIRAVAQKDFETWWSRGEAFFRSALFNRQHKECKIAAFLLHQAAENVYQAVLLSFTGYKPCTHNLDKLRLYTNRFALALSLVFPRNSPEEDRIFRLLLQAYVDARYKEEYCITEMEVDTLIERLTSLLSVAARICRNRFASLEKMNGAPHANPC
jgi:HEPN domain-containing protein